MQGNSAGCDLSFEGSYCHIRRQQDTTHGASPSILGSVSSKHQILLLLNIISPLQVLKSFETLLN